jgi:beta-phosphoglucomutase
MKELKACIFDMDGVVIDNKEFHIEAWRKYSGMLGFRFNYHEVKSWFGATNEAILSTLYGDKLTQEEMKSMGSKKNVFTGSFMKKVFHP